MLQLVDNDDGVDDENDDGFNSNQWHCIVFVSGNKIVITPKMKTVLVYAVDFIKVNKEL